MKTQDIVTAIGVCATAADIAYDVSTSVQGDAWNALRAAVYHLTRLLEDSAKEEVL